MNDHRVQSLCLKLLSVPRSLVAQLVPLIEKRKLHVATKIISQLPTEVLRRSDRSIAHDPPLFPKSTFATKAIPATSTVDWATITHTNPPLSPPSLRPTAALVPHDAPTISHLSRALTTSLLSPIGVVCLILLVLLLLLVYTAACRKEATACRKEATACRKEVEELSLTLEKNSANNKADQIEMRVQQLEERAGETEAESRKIDTELQLAKKRIIDDKTRSKNNETRLKAVSQERDNLALRFENYVRKTKADSKTKDEELQLAKQRIDDDKTLLEAAVQRKDNLAKKFEDYVEKTEADSRKIDAELQLGKKRIEDERTLLEAAIQQGDDLKTRFGDYVEKTQADSQKKDEQLQTDVDDVNNQIKFAKTAIESLQQKPVLTIANVESLITPVRGIISKAEEYVTSLQAQVDSQERKQAQTATRLQQQGNKIEGQSRQLLDVQLTLKSLDTRGTANDRTRSARQQRRKAAKEAERAASAFIDPAVLPFLARFSVAGPFFNHIPRFETGHVLELDDNNSEDAPTSTALVKFTCNAQALQPTTSSPASGPSSESNTNESAEQSTESSEGNDTPPLSDPPKNAELSTASSEGSDTPSTSDPHPSTEQATASSEGSDMPPTSDPDESTEQATDATQNPPPTGPSGTNRESARARHWRIFLESKRTGNGFFDGQGAWHPNNPRWSQGGGRGQAFRGGRGGGGGSGSSRGVSQAQPPVQQGPSPTQFNMNWDPVLGRWVPRQ